MFGIGMASLFSDMSHETVTATLPAFLASMGAAAGALGTIEGFADGFSSIAKLYGGWLADRLRRRKVLCAGGYGFMAFSPVVIALATNSFVVLGGRVLAWVSRGLRTPARKALLADAVTPATNGRAFGFERALDTIGAIVAPLAVLGLLHAGLGHRNIILLSTIPAILAVFAIALLVREPSGEAAGQVKGGRMPGRPRHGEVTPEVGPGEPCRPRLASRPVTGPGPGMALPCWGSREPVEYAVTARCGRCGRCSLGES